MRVLFTIVVLAFMVFPISLRAQENKALKKGLEYYDRMQYSKAIPFFEEALLERDQLTTRSKLANCYRMMNRTNEAEGLYRTIVKNSKANPKSYYYLAEMLMYNGKYEEAKEWFFTYTQLSPEDEQGKRMYEACSKVKFIEPFYKNVVFTPITINSDSDDFAPVYYQDGIAFVSDRKTNWFQQKFDWTGRSFSKLYKSDNITEEVYDGVRQFARLINYNDKNSGPCTFNNAQDEIYFTRNGHEASQGNVYKMQIFKAERKNNVWKKYELASFSYKESNFMHPTLSEDGNAIYFASDKPGGYGGTDIYVCYKGSNGEWRRPVNLGPTVNTAENEAFPYIHHDGRLYFCSKGHAGFGGFDVFVTKELGEANWAEPQNLGEPINSAQDDTGFILSEDGMSGMIASPRGKTDDDIYFFKLVDILFDGNVVDKDTGKEIRDAQVQFYTENGQLVAESGDFGDFELDLDLNKNYKIVIQKEGYVPFEGKVSTLGVRTSTRFNSSFSLLKNTMQSSTK